MTPFFFGSADRQLFGVYQPPQKSPARGGVVICAPWGQEALRAHRSLRLLANLLVASGFHALRFDYFGTGDSAGDLDSGDPPSWHDDVCAAIDELVAMAGVQQITLCGLRMGAAWAARAAAGRSDVAALLAWDPVVDGAAHAAELEARASASPGRLETRGFTLTADTLADFRGVTAALYAGLGFAVRVLTTRENPHALELTRPAGPAGAEVTVAHVPGPCAWEEEGDFGSAGLPVEALHRIVDWLA